jgi:hypothetical protein
MTIKGQDYKLKYTLRALFIYEQITGKAFELKTITDEYLFFYCVLMANNPDSSLTFEELIEAIDEDMGIMVEFQNFLKKELEKQQLFITNNTDAKKKVLTTKEIYSALVIEGGLDPEYVLDKMQMYELEPLISNLHRKDRNSWEQARMIAYVIAQCNSTKKLKPTDIMQFTWDSDTIGETSISNEDIKRLKEKAKQYTTHN